MDKLTFLFPGQGTQFNKMGYRFYEKYEVSKDTYEEASQVLGIDVPTLCFESSYSEINNFTNMQIAIVTTEIAIFRAYMHELGMSPQFAIGHSIGEYAALVCAGAIAFKDALKILNKRGQLVEKIMQEPVGSMTIVENTNENAINSAIAETNSIGRTYISCYNTKEQFAISGHRDSLDKVEEWLAGSGAVLTPLMFSPPMHSPLLNPIRDEFHEFLESITYYSFRFPIISNVTGKPFANKEIITDVMANQLVFPIRFNTGLNFLYQYGATITVEMSPKVLLNDFVDKELPDIRKYCYGVKKQRHDFIDLIGSDSNYKRDMPNFVGRCLGILASTENKNQEDRVIAKINNFNKSLKKIYQSDQRELEKDAMVKITEDLIEVLRLKKLSNYEIKDWIKILLDDNNLHYLLHSVFISI